MRATCRPIWPVAIGAVLASLTVAVTPADATQPAPATTAAALPDGQPETPHPVDSSVRSYAVRGVTGVGLRTLSHDGMASAPGDHLAALSAPEPATGFAVTGVTWSGRSPAGLSLSIRTRTDLAWSGWTTLNYDEEHGPSPSSSEAEKAVPGTDPFVVGAVDDIQLRARSDSGRAPAGMTMSVVDPGTSAADASPDPISPDEAVEDTAPTVANKAATTRSSNAPVVSRSATPMPTIYSRADWGAQESLRDCCVEYGEVHAGFVHHTVNANGYSKAEVPAILRGIYAYHTQSRGWRDIGYNYLVDRFGRIWEGRFGGVALPVVGAHTLNYNENSFAASAIGNYDTAQPSAAVVDAYARLYAWKLSLHGVRPNTRQNVAGTTFDAISGHRDAAQTACPGRYLYARIPTIISKATSYEHSFLGRDVQHSFVRDSRPDLLMVGSKGAVSVARGTGPPGFARPVVTTSTLAGKDQVVPVRDVNGDGVADLMVRTAKTGSTSVRPGMGDGTFGAPVDATDKWAGADLLAGPGDVTGDGLDDVVWRSKASGTLRVYPGRGDGTFGAAAVAIKDATGLNLVTPAGDFDGDGEQDLITRGVNGAVFVRFGNGMGAFPTDRRLAVDWSGKDVISGGADLTGDHRPDVVARTARTQVVSTYANIGGVRFSPAIGHRTTSSHFLALSRDVSGDGPPDLVSLTRTDRVQVFEGSRHNWLHAPESGKVSWTGTDKVMVVGDWDRDGFVDAMARRRSTGSMWLYRGTRTGTFSAAVGNWAGWGARTQITPVGDFNGDGNPDLMAQASNRAIYLYPGRGLGGFRAPILVRSSLPSGSTAVAVGLWNSDGAPDVLVRTGGGQMLLYPGNGPGGLDEPTVIGGNFGSYTALIGVGDLTGDGQADLVGRLTNGQAWLIPGRPVAANRPVGGFAPRQFISASWGPYRLG